MTIQSMALIGTGVMGMGIAQIAAQAGLEVRLFDAKSGAAEAGLAKLRNTLEKLQAKGKFTEEVLNETLARFKILSSIEEVAGVDLVVEAIWTSSKACLNSWKVSYLQKPFWQPIPHHYQ